MIPWISILVPAAAVSCSAIYAVSVDRFRNPATGIVVLIGGILPWIMVSEIMDGLSHGTPISFIGLLGSGPLFLGALLRYWLGPRFPEWGKASCAMVIGILCATGFFMAVVRALSGGE